MLELYGTEVGNCIVRNLPFGGVFLFGSISKTLQKQFEKKDPKCTFQAGFFNKDFMVETLKKIPVYVLQNVDLGLEGAFMKGKQIVMKELG